MKYFSIGLMFLVMGCQTIVSEGISPAVKEEPLKVVEEKQSKAPNNPDKPSFVSTNKPIVCGDAKSIMTHLTEQGEVPVATWYDQTGSYPVIFLVNIKSGNSSVLEFPGQAFPNGPFENLACFVSIGMNTEVNEPRSLKTHIHLLQK